MLVIVEHCGPGLSLQHNRHFTILDSSLTICYSTKWFDNRDKSGPEVMYDDASLEEYVGWEDTILPFRLKTETCAKVEKKPARTGKCTKPCDDSSKNQQGCYSFT